MQSQRNGIEDNNNVELLSANIKKMQNTVEVGTLASDETASLTKGAMGRKRVDVSIGKVICTIG